MKKVLLLICFLTTIILSCQKHETPINYEAISVSIDSLKKELLLSELINVHEVIPLDSHQDGMIEWAKEITITESHIYVRNSDSYRSLSVLIFDRNGKYLNRITGSGKGPEEILLPDDFTYDIQSNLIYILDRGQKKVVVYDKEGYYIRHFNINFHAHSIEFFSDSLLAFFSEGQYNLIVTNLDGEEVYHQFDHEGLFQIGSPNAFYQDSKATYFSRWIDDTLYSVNPKNAIPGIVFDCGKNAMTRKQFASLPSNGMNKNIPDGHFFGAKPLAVSNHDIIYSFAYTGSGRYISFFDRIQKSSITINSKNIKHDLTAGLFPFRPGGIFQDSLFIGSITPGLLDESVSLQIAEKMINIDPNDNPLILLYTLK